MNNYRVEQLNSCGTGWEVKEEDLEIVAAVESLCNAIMENPRKSYRLVEAKVLACYTYEASESLPHPLSEDNEEWLEDD